MNTSYLRQDEHIDYRWLILLFLTLTALYTFTASSTIVFEDDVIGFTVSCLYGDIAHAPGYPLHALLCPTFNFLPLTPPLVAAFFSAVLGALSCVFLAQITCRLNHDAPVALCVGLLYGVSLSFWSQANIPEVYTLNTALFFLAWLILLKWCHQPHSNRLILFFFVCALGLTNHWPLFILASIALPFFVWRQYAELKKEVFCFKIIFFIFFAIGIGLSPYFYLWWRSNNPVAFLRLPFAPHDITSLWQIISRQVLVGIDDQSGTTWHDKKNFMLFFMRHVFFKEVSVIGGFFLLIGFFQQWKRLDTFTILGLISLFLFTAIILILRVDFLYDGVSEETFIPYLIIPYAIACIWIGFALKNRWRVPLLLCLCIVVLISNFSANNRRNNTLITNITTMYLRHLPPGGFFVENKLQPFLIYAHHVEKQPTQADIFYSPNPYFLNTFFPGKKLYPINTLSYEEELSIVSNYAQKKPTCYNTYIQFNIKKPTQEHLLFSCFRNDNEPSAQVIPEISDFFLYLADEYIEIDWTSRKFVAQLIQDAVYAMLLLKSHQELPSEWKDLLETLLLTPIGQLTFLEYLHQQPELTLSKRRAEKMASIAQRNMPLLNRRQQVRLLSAMGNIYSAVLPRDESTLQLAKEYHTRAANLIPSASSIGVKKALAFYQKENMYEEIAKLQNKYKIPLLVDKH